MSLVLESFFRLNMFSLRDLLEGMDVSMLNTLDALLIKPAEAMGLDKSWPVVGKALELFYMHIKDNKFGVLPLINGAKLGPIEVTTGKSGFRTLANLVSVYGLNLDLLDMISMVQEVRCKMKNGSMIPWGGTHMNTNQVSETS